MFNVEIIIKNPAPVVDAALFLFKVNVWREGWKPFAALPLARIGPVQVHFTDELLSRSIHRHNKHHN